MRPDDELFEHARADTFDPRSIEAHRRERLHMPIERHFLVDGREIVSIVTERVLAFVVAVTPFRMGVADAGHVEIEFRRELRAPLAAFRIDRLDDAGFRVTRA